MVYNLQIISIENPKALHQFVLSILRHDPTGRFSTYSEAKKELVELPKTFDLKMSFFDINRLEQALHTDGVEMIAVLDANQDEGSAAESWEKTRVFSRIGMLGLAFTCFGLLVFGITRSSFFQSWIDGNTKPEPDEIVKLLPNLAQPPSTPDKNKANQSGEPAKKSDTSLDIKEYSSKMLNATVLISDGPWLGSGFFISPVGHILTNRHVVSNMHAITVTTYNQNSYRAELISESDNLDLALIKIEKTDGELLPIGDAADLSVGETIYVIGNPRGLSFSMSRGIISSVEREINGALFIQSDASINPGNSGGPMINSEGRIIGVATQIITQSGGSEGLGFALPINYAYQDSDSIAAGILLKPTSYHNLPLTAPSTLTKYSSKVHPQPKCPRCSDTEEARHLNDEYSTIELETTSRLQDFEKNSTAIASSIANIQKQQKDSPSLNEKDDLEREVERLRSKLRVLNIERLEYAIKQIRRQIDVLDRLKGLDLNELQRNSVDSKIEHLKTERKTIEESLAQIQK